MSIDPNFPPYWKQYIIQSSFAALTVFPFMNILFFKAIWFSLSVGITILLMVVLDVEHPPAAGTALGMTLIAYSATSATAILISVLFLAIIGHITKPFLKDLV